MSDIIRIVSNIDNYKDYVEYCRIIGLVGCLDGRLYNIQTPGTDCLFVYWRARGTGLTNFEHAWDVIPDEPLHASKIIEYPANYQRGPLSKYGVDAALKAAIDYYRSKLSNL